MPIDQQTIDQSIIGKRIVAVSWLLVPEGGCDLESIMLEGGVKLNLLTNHFGEVEAEIMESKDANHLTLLVRKDDLQLILGGLDEYWITFPEHKPAIERLQRAIGE